MKYYSYANTRNESIDIRSAATGVNSGTAYIDTSDGWMYLPPSEFPAFVRGLCEAAGIFADVEVSDALEDLFNAIGSVDRRKAIEEMTSDIGTATGSARILALRLIDKGYRKA